ncbi:MAG TPA: hypothetical protein VIT92_12860 [Burkholderiaceae bacterium]
MADEIDGAMQQAPQPGRHETVDIGGLDAKEAGIPSFYREMTAFRVRSLTQRQEKRDGRAPAFLDALY